ncbi:ATP-binding cassette domain-containing protein [Pseudomonas asuensis]
MHALSLQGLNVGYGKKTIIQDLTLDGIAHGKVTALLGPNGSGKSTLLKAIAGLTPAKGTVELDGEALTSLSFAKRAEKVVYLPQTLPASVHLRVYESL